MPSGLGLLNTAKVSTDGGGLNAQLMPAVDQLLQVQSELVVSPLSLPAAGSC
jgi:hypothetical protein